VLVYLYQMWQDEVLLSPEQKESIANLQPVAAKPLHDNREKSSEDEE